MTVEVTRQESLRRHNGEIPVEFPRTAVRLLLLECDVSAQSANFSQTQARVSPASSLDPPHKNGYGA
jgi:hypothetical protein